MVLRAEFLPQNLHFKRVQAQVRLLDDQALKAVALRINVPKVVYSNALHGVALAEDAPRGEPLRDEGGALERLVDTASGAGVHQHDGPAEGPLRHEIIILLLDLIAFAWRQLQIIVRHVEIASIVQVYPLCEHRVLLLGLSLFLL